MDIANIISGIVGILGAIGTFYAIHTKMQSVRANTKAASAKADLEISAAKAKHELELKAATSALDNTDSLAFRENLFNQINTLTALLNAREKHIEEKDRKIEILIQQNTELLVEVGKLRSEVEHLTDIVATHQKEPQA